MTEPPPRPPASLPMAAHGHQVQPHHETVLPADDEAATAQLAELAEAGRFPEGATAELRRICAAHPGCLDAWARLGQAAYANRDLTTAYACARVGYHRGLDRLRRHGWGGTGQVRWSQPDNRGFLRSLHLLMLAAAAISEEDENLRCRQFLLDLDPEDGLELGRRAPLKSGELVAPEELP